MSNIKKWYTDTSSFYIKISSRMGNRTGFKGVGTSGKNLTSIKAKLQYFLATVHVLIYSLETTSTKTTKQRTVQPRTLFV